MGGRETATHNKPDSIMTTNLKCSSNCLTVSSLPIHGN